MLVEWRESVLTVLRLFMIIAISPQEATNAQKENGRSNQIFH